MKVNKSTKKAALNKGNGSRLSAVTSKKASSIKGNGKSMAKKSENFGISKQYLKTGNICNVTFKLPQEAALDATVVTVVGEFNNWSLNDTPMKKLKNGSFKTTLKLPCGSEYKFRYLIDSSRWENDWCADEYEPNAFGGEDSVIKI